MSESSGGAGAQPASSRAAVPSSAAARTGRVRGAVRGQAGTTGMGDGLSDGRGRIGRLLREDTEATPGTAGRDVGYGSPV
ncbi:Uncharacterised protein [Mycobacteroides abscessus subsp. abscessus]|nr:Uncharacterised protein [Mycobacteroides abscessus subsp. abscessus]